MLWYLLLILQLVLIYLTSRYVMTRLFHALKRMTHSTSVSFYIISLIYLPGTIVHEMSHLLTSVLLFVMPHKIDFIPEISQNEDGRYAVKMGSVHHAPTDPFRGTLIGSAPIVFGLAFFYIVFEFSLFPHTEWWMNVLFVYLFFSISSSMFSSKQDLKESLFMVPVLLFAIAAMIGFNIDIERYFLSGRIFELVKDVNLYLAAATATNTLGSLLLMKVR